MCECLRGIFRVTWTPSSDADSDREDSHVFSRTRDPAVKDKRRSPPPRSPAGPQHSGLTDEQESPERTVQKEKLHAELKQVLSQKRSHLRESTCQLAQPEMDCEPTDEQTKGVEDDFRKSVEIVVETDAEVGASGYSVTGGGERGIFVKDVLKDSPAAKHLSLQQGDQLLSAKVYFDNVRYEDALKILQCAEPYKVSFQLKRTVPETEVSVRPRILGGDVKGPKAKVAKMSVKGTKLFKTQRRRGGRFGLKRLKEKNKEDVVMEGTPPSLEAGDVDVEFSLPTFRQRKGVNEAEPVVGKGKKRIRFPHMKTKSYTGAVPGGKLGIRRLEVDENIFPPETSGAEVKTKGKGHKFGIAFPKSKHNKSGSAQTGSLERKPPEVRIHPPSVEFDVSSVKDVEKRGLKLKSPDVEFALPSGKAGGSVSTVEETSESKAPKGDVRREADAAGGKVHADISKGDAKLRMPKLKLPKVRLSRHSDEIDSALQVKTPKAEMKGDDKIQLPEGPDIRMPKVEGDLSGGAASVQIPSVEISLPKVKGTFDADVSLPESGVKACVNMPDVEVSGSEMDLQLNAKQKVPDEVEGMFKGLKISMPKVDISLPKTGFAGVEGPGVGGKISLPSVDISLPQMKSGGGDVDMGCYVGGDGKFKMPEFDPTFPDMKSSDKEEEGNFKMPKVDLNLPIGKAGTTDDDGAASQLPSMEVSLPKMKRNKVEVSTKGGKLKMPEVKFSPPKGNIQGGFEVEGQAGKEGKFKMPTVDVLMPKLKQAEGPIEGPEMMSGVEIQLPSNDASLPTAKMKGNIEIEGPSAKGGKFTMPPVNIKLPQMGSTEAGVDLHGQKMEVASGDVSLKPMGDIEGKVKGGKFTLPSVDICLPKMKLPKGDVTLEGPDLNLSLPSSGNKVKGDSDGGKFKMPTCDISLQKGKIKEGEMNIREPEVKGEKFQMPSFDVSLPQIRKRGEDVDVELPKLKGGEIKAPTIEISPVQGTFEGNFDLESDGKEGEFRLHGMKFPEGEGNFQGPKVKGAKFEMPKIDLSLPRGKTQGAFHTEIHSGKDGNKEMASCDFDVPKGELSADINVDGLERKTEKFKLPKIDISLPKLNLPEGEVKFEGPETKGQMEKPSLDIIPPEGKLDVDVDGHKAKGSKFHMPTININLPKIKSKEVSIDVKGPEGEEGKLPSCDITLPDKEFPEANVSLGGPNVKGGQINVPGVEGLLPETNGKVGMSVETPEGNLEKLQMPKFDIAIPKVNFPDSAGKMKKPDLKIKKMKMPDIDIPLSKGKAEIDIEIDGGKGKKFHIPSVDFSLPRIKTKGLEVKTGGVEEKIQMPDTDVSLSEGKVEVDTNVGVPEVKGGKFKMPKFDISFSNKNLPEGKPEVDISTAKGKIKEDVDLGGKLPTVDFSPPKMQAKELHVDIKPPETTNLHISSPKVALPGGDVKIECPDIKGRKIEMPDIDLSLPKGKGKGDIETTGSSHKGGKFHMPAIDITLPKMKTKGAEVHVESPEVKGGQIKMPSLHVSEPKLKFPDIDDSLKGPEVEGKIKKPKGDISLPKGEVQGDLEVEGPDMKGGKFKMPKFDVSLPKVSLSKIDASVEGPDLKGKAEMPSVDISVPKGTTDLGVDVDPGKGSKFHMPSLDITLPKMKTKGLNVNVEGPEVKGDMSLSEVKSPDVDVNIKGPEVVGGYISLPNVDVAFPKTKGDFEVEVPDMKDGKFKMPKFDVSLPKVSLPKFDANVKGPDLKGKAEMPSVDISVPKATTDVGVDVDTGKGSKFHMPSLDISLPKMKAKGFDVNIEGPEVKGDISLPEVRSPDVDFNLQGPEVEGGKLSLPKVDIALPKTEGDFEVEGPDIKGGKFKMPKFDLSLPKVSLPKFDASVEGPDLKGKAEMQSVDISVPKATTDVEVDVDTGKGSTFHMPSLDISLPKIKAKGFDVNIEGPEVKGDISLPEVRSPDVDFNLQGTEVEGGKLSLPKVNVALPKIEGDFEVEGPEMKGGKFKMPKFDVSLPKVSLPKFDASVEGPDLKGKAEIRSVEMSVPKGTTDFGVDVDTGKFYMPSLDISLPKMKGKKFDVNVEGPEVKGDISLPEVRSPDVDFNLRGSEVEGGTLSLPNVDIALPKTEGDIEVEGPDIKGGKFKMPKFDLSLPKVSLPKFDASVEGPDLKGKAEIQSVDISVPKGTTNLGVDVDTGKGSKFHMPSLDISLPKMKGKGFDVNIEGPEVKGDISLPEVKSPDVDFNLQGPEVKGGKLSLPKVDIALPKTEGDIEVEGPDMKVGKFKMPKFDLSLPKVSLPKFDASVEGPDLKGKAEMQSVDISVPKGTTDLGVDVDTGKDNKFHMPSLDLTLPKMKTKGLNVNVEGPEVRGDMPFPKIKTPVTDVNLQSPEVERGDVKMPTLDVSLPKPEGDSEIQGPEVKGGKYKMPKLPKVSLPEANVKVIGPDINVGKIEMPDIDISLPKGKAKGDAELEGHTGKRGKFHLPAIDISLPKIKTNEPEIHIKGPEVKGGKIPDIDFSLPRGEVDADLNLEGPEKRGQVKMPKVDVSFPQIKLAGDVIVKGPEMKGKITEPAVDFSKGERKMEGDIKKAMGLHMPSIDLHLPKVDFDLSLPSGSKGRGLKVDTSGPDASADVQMSGIKGQLKPPKIKATDASINTGSVDNPGASLKLPTVKLPTVDISAPKVDLDFGLTKSIGDEVEVQLLKAEGGRPLSGGSFDLPDVSLKAPSFTFPRFGGKSKSSELQISKSEVFISPPDVEGEVKTPSVEFDDEGKVKVKKNKIKIPSFRLSKKDPDVSVSCPDVDVKGKKENVDIQTQKISVEGSSDKTKYKVKLPKFKISSPTAKLPEKEGDMRVEADGKGGFHAPDVTIKLPKFSMPGLGSKEKDLGKPVGEVETKTKLKMPSVELSLQETKTPDTEVVLPKAEVDVSEADIRGYEGNLKVPKMPKIDDSIPKVDPDVSLPKGKSQKIEKPDMDVKGEGKFKIPQIKMPSVDIDIPKGKSVLPDVEVDVDRGKFNMPYVKMPSVDITLPKPKTGKALNVDAEGDVRLRMPDIKMPNVNISEGTNNKLEGPNVDIQGRGKLKTADVYASDLETPDGKTDWDSERSFKMPSVDISLPKGKLKGNNTPEMEMGVEGEGKVKLPHMKMPDFDVSFPKRRTKDSQMEIKDKGGKLKTPNVSTPPIDISLSTGKDTEVEESSGGKFKMPIWKRPDVDIPLPKGHMEGPEVESTGERGGLKMPHISLPYVDISLPKRKADAPHVERGDGEEKCTTLYMKMPSVDPNVQLKGEEGPKFQMPHVKMPNIEFSLPKGKDIPKLKTEREEGKVRMPSVDISIPTGKIPGPNAEAEGGQGPHIKMPHVNITLPRGKSDKIDGAELETEREGKSNISHMTLPSVDISLPRGQTNDNSPDIKGERKKFKMAKEDFSLPKGRSLVEGLDVDIKGDPSMAAAKAEGGHIKLPHMKFPKVDISLPKGRSRGTSSSAIEMDVTSPEGNIPKVPSSKAEIELPTAEAQCKLKVPQGAHLDSSSEGNQASLKLKIPTIEIKSPKEDLELQTGSHKEEGNKDNKKIELPDLDLTLEGSGGKGKGPKNKGAKFKIRKHKKKTCKDTSAKPQSEEEAGEQVKHNSSKDGVNVQLPGVTPPTVSLKTKKCDVGGSSPSTAEVRVPRIPDIEFDIGTSQDEEDGQTENKIKIPKFGIPLPSISSPERLAHGPDIQYEGPKIPKVKKAVFVLVNPSEPDDSVAGPSLQKEQTKAETEIEEATVKISKKKSSFGKSKDKSATESAERRVEEEEISRGLKMKMPKVKFSPAKSGSFGVKGDSSSPNGEKDASPHKDDKGTFGGKLKLPKVELTSPYGKMAAGEENKGARFQKDSSLVEVKTEFRGLPAPAESAGDVVTSHARTEMLDRDRSEIPDGLEFSSAKVQMWSESKEAEERESSSWFKVPKVTLKPLSSGFLQITPEGSPQAERKGEVAGMEDVSGSFCIHASGLDFAAQQMSEEHHASEEGTVTMVTKTTRITQQIVTSQTHTAESSTTTSGQVSDSNF
ncbi:neuroblast differentiation-associated protein AHNAK isoform X5 [Oryzias latipes]|uniref:neuroblast differentiation-associated protein AHNAK isoform X5 n=1 Tax=Oryzias latipes TaxID=8090 RepID=UPI0005CBF0B6|nr:neuroblast differentiation-associated protein AHNAK isoform X5 [Oryzias latipes]